jgi:tRNA nucleotidyltransferase/poly(A) polymerase
MTGLPGLWDGKLRDPSAIKAGPLAQALKALNDATEETRVVGGAVRDLALGLKPSDFDLATTASPDEVIRRAHAAGFKIAPTGISHGTVSLIMGRQVFETTTLREDVDTDGRHAKVAFGRNFPSDARRRDFTINALSLDVNGQVHDSVGGLDDLAAGRVRFIGDAEMRIREDYLRILRFFRFSARFGAGALDRDGLTASVRARLGLSRLSRERLRMEVLKLIVAPHAAEVIQTMGDCGILAQLFGFAYPGRLRRTIAIEAGADALLRLAALVVAVREDAERVSDRLRLSKAEGERLARAATALTTLHGQRKPPSANALRILLFMFKRQAAEDALVLAQAESATSPTDHEFAQARQFLATVPEPKSPVGGAEILARGVAAGPRVGEILRRFERLWAEAGFPTEEKRLAALIRSAAEAPPCEETP